MDIGAERQEEEPGREGSDERGAENGEGPPFEVGVFRYVRSSSCVECYGLPGSFSFIIVLKS